MPTGPQPNVVEVKPARLDGEDSPHVINVLLTVPVTGPAEFRDHYVLVTHSTAVIDGPQDENQARFAAEPPPAPAHR